MYTDENYVYVQREGMLFKQLKYIGKEKIVHVPAELEDDHGCFHNNQEVEEIIYTTGNKKSGGFAFCNNLRSVFFSDTIETLTKWLFLDDCDNLIDLEVDSRNPFYVARDGLLLTKDETKLVFCVPGVTGEINVPETVIEIGDKAFSGCKKIEKISLPNNLEKIGFGAFSHCVDLKHINLPEKINTLPDYCFDGCVNLETLDLSHISNIQNSAFTACKKLVLTVPANVGYIASGAFYDCTPSQFVFEEGAGSVSALDVFLSTIEVGKELIPYPNLPLDLFKKPEVKLWMTMGFCSEPNIYTGYIQKQYAQYAKSQKKRILKMAQEKGFGNVLAYYGEVPAETSNDNSDLTGKVSLSMTEEEAKKLFKYSKRSTGISINEFKGIRTVWQSTGNFDSYFLNGVSNRLILPDYIGEKPVGKIAVSMLPDNAVVFCNDLVFQKLKRTVRVSTACAYLEKPEEFPNEQKDAIEKFIAKYIPDVADKLIESGTVEAVTRFIDSNKITEKLFDEMLEKAKGRAELTALILERKETGKKTSKKKTTDSLEEAFEVAEKPLPLSELKKLWTYSVYTSYEDPAIKLIELKHYKGHEKKVVVPSQFGKNSLGAIRGRLLEGHDDVTELVLPTGDYDIDVTLDNCSHLADSDGYIIVHAGDRAILTDYIGDKNLYSLTTPKGITEFSYGVFRKLSVREIIISEGCERFYSSAIIDCDKLQRIVFSEGLKEITHLSFMSCPVLKDIFIPVSVKAIGRSAQRFRIHGVPGSEAETYAAREQMEFLEQTNEQITDPMPDFVIEDDLLERYLGNDTSISVPVGVKRIKNNAFTGCDFITSVTLSEGLEIIGSFAFMDCSNLTSINFPKSLAEIGSYAFSGCRNLKHIVFPENLKTIGDHAFMWCHNLSEINIPDNVTSIGKDAFSACRNLRDVYLTDGIQKIESQTFSNDYSENNQIRIHGKAGSYAQKYAEENQLEFVE